MNDAATKSGPTVLVLADYFYPGFRAGGPIKSLKLMIERLGDVNFKVITRDRDLGNLAPYPESLLLHPSSHSNLVSVDYVDTTGILGKVRLVQAIRTSESDLLYLNSFWSPFFSQIPLLLVLFKIIPRQAILISPRGELAVSARSQSALKKAFVGGVAKRLYSRLPIVWHATSPSEASDIESYWQNANVKTVPNFSGQVERGVTGHAMANPPKCLFVSRVSPKKNLWHAIKAISLTSSATLDVIGPLEDANYVVRCQDLVSELGLTNRVRFLGERPPEELDQLYGKYDIFLFPTYNENHGHVITEALSHGLPVLCSSQTPWTNQLNKLGLVTPEPEDAQGFADEIESMRALPLDSYLELRRLCALFMTELAAEQNEKCATGMNDLVFSAALGRGTK